MAIRIAIVKEYGLKVQVPLKQMTSNWVTAKSRVPQNPFLDSVCVEDVEEIATPSDFFLSRKSLSTSTRSLSNLLKVASTKIGADFASGAALHLCCGSHRYGSNGICRNHLAWK